MLVPEQCYKAVIADNNYTIFLMRELDRLRPTGNCDEDWLRSKAAGPSLYHGFFNAYALSYDCLVRSRKVAEAEALEETEEIIYLRTTQTAIVFAAIRLFAFFEGSLVVEKYEARGSKVAKGGEKRRSALNFILRSLNLVIISHLRKDSPNNLSKY